jgi:hypothetical protein
MATKGKKGKYKIAGRHYITGPSLPFGITVRIGNLASCLTLMVTRNTAAYCQAE